MNGPVPSAQQDQHAHAALLGYVLCEPVSIGAHSYVSELCHISQETTIGKFCSIGNLCTIGAQPHRIDGLSSYPWQRIWMHEENWKPVATRVGNDVWIGSGVTVMAGLTVGDGAVLGAGSVVTKDVPPYAVVVGNPARVLKYRFPPDVIEELLASKWWDLPLDTIEVLPRENIRHCVDILREIRLRAAA